MFSELIYLMLPVKLSCILTILVRLMVLLTYRHIIVVELRDDII